MTQKIYPDPYGIDTWDENEYGSVFIHIVNSSQFRKLTGLNPPPTPVNAKTYIDFGLPWFKLYDEDEGDLEPSKKLVEVLSIKEKDRDNSKSSNPQTAPGKQEKS